MLLFLFKNSAKIARILFETKFTQICTEILLIYTLVHFSSDALDATTFSIKTMPRTPSWTVGKS
ncbi:MAG: hypothetical protein ACI9LN_002419 [Saprospiraceae bacterium]|jgi:hypothetical protein